MPEKRTVEQLHFLQREQRGGVGGDHGGPPPPVPPVLCSLHPGFIFNEGCAGLKKKKREKKERAHH